MLVKQFKFKRIHDTGGYQWIAQSEIESPGFSRGFTAVGKTLADVKEFAALVLRYWMGFIIVGLMRNGACGLIGEQRQHDASCRVPLCAKQAYSRAIPDGPPRTEPATRDICAKVKGLEVGASE